MPGSGREPKELQASAAMKDYTPNRSFKPDRITRHMETLTKRALFHNLSLRQKREAIRKKLRYLLYRVNPSKILRKLLLHLLRHLDCLIRGISLPLSGDSGVGSSGSGGSALKSARAPPVRGSPLTTLIAVLMTVGISFVARNVNASEKMGIIINKTGAPVAVNIEGCTSFGGLNPIILGKYDIEAFDTDTGRWIDVSRKDVIDKNPNNLLGSTIAEELLDEYGINSTDLLITSPQIVPEFGTVVTRQKFAGKTPLFEEKLRALISSEMFDISGLGLASKSYAAPAPTRGIEVRVTSLQEEFDMPGAPEQEKIKACTTYNGLDLFVEKDNVKAFINGEWAEMKRNAFFDKNPSMLNGATILEQPMEKWGLKDTDLLNASSTLSFELGGIATDITVYKLTGGDALFEKTANIVIPHIDITGFGSFKSGNGEETLTLTYKDNGDKIAFYPQPGSAAGAFSGEYSLRGFNGLLGNAIPWDEKIEGHDFTIKNGVLEMLICTNKGIYRFEDATGTGAFVLEDHADFFKPTPKTSVSASLNGTIRYKGGSVTLNCTVTNLPDGGTDTAGTGIYHDDTLLVAGEGTYTADGTIPKGETLEGRCNADGLTSSSYKTVQDTPCEMSVTGAKSKYNEGDDMQISATITDADGDDYTPTISGAVPNGAGKSTWLNGAGIGGTIGEACGGDLGNLCSFSNKITAGVVGNGGCEKQIEEYTVRNKDPPPGI